MSDVTETSMISIPQEDYDRYKRLELLDRRTHVQAAQDAVLNLEDDIDQPLKNVVAMINLMGVQTIWSCCGFDYSGQPEHKFHEYGSVYIRMHFNEASYGLVYNLVKTGLSLPWNGAFYNCGGGTEAQLKAMFGHTDHLKPWDNVACPHYAEVASFAIFNLEHQILQFRSMMRDMVVMLDTNGMFQKQFENWQYSPKKSWTIIKSDVLKNFPEVADADAKMKEKTKEEVPS
jgi:hypothetical protein